MITAREQSAPRFMFQSYTISRRSDKPLSPPTPSPTHSTPLLPTPYRLTSSRPTSHFLHQFVTRKGSNCHHRRIPPAPILHSRPDLLFRRAPGPTFRQPFAKPEHFLKRAKRLNSPAAAPSMAAEPPRVKSESLRPSTDIYISSREAVVSSSFFFDSYLATIL